MVSASIKVKKIWFNDRFLCWHRTDEIEEPVYPGVDGAVQYEVKIFYTEEEQAKRLKAGYLPDNPWIVDCYFQPFSKNGTFQVIDKTGYSRNVWLWDGNIEKPTLSPSWLTSDDYFRIHLYFQNGEINLLGDSKITFREP